jgi:FKBP-type peptidyl-prolyl cis-trans isomerase
MKVSWQLFKFIFIPYLLLEMSCHQKKQENRPVPVNAEEQMINANKAMLKKEAAKIDAFVKEKGWEMQKTGSGLRYMIYEHGTGDTARKAMIAKINYEVTLLDGTLCYSSKEKGPQEFTISQDNVESGLHEGILLMRVGDKAKFIMPPHLAHGVLGDENKIPALSTIVYDVELLSIR